MSLAGNSRSERGVNGCRNLLFRPVDAGQYPTLDEATRALADVLTDEPQWRGRLSVLEVNFAEETATLVLL